MYRIVSSFNDSSTIFSDATCRSIFLFISMLSFSRSAFWRHNVMSSGDSQSGAGRVDLPTRRRNQSDLKVSYLVVELWGRLHQLLLLVGELRQRAMSPSMKTSLGLTFKIKCLKVRPCPSAWPQTVTSDQVCVTLNRVCVMWVKSFLRLEEWLGSPADFWIQHRTFRPADSRISPDPPCQRSCSSPGWCPVWFLIGLSRSPPETRRPVSISTQSSQHWTPPSPPHLQSVLQLLQLSFHFLQEQKWEFMNR